MITWQRAGYIFIVSNIVIGCYEPKTQVPVKTDTTQSKNKRILVVHSYHARFEWTSGIQRGIERALSQVPNLEIGVFYMDTKRKPSMKHKEWAGQLALDMTEEWKPDVVITSDDNAQVHYAKHLVGKENVKIIFCGVNAHPGTYNFPASNVTGILERTKFDESLDFLSKLYPRAHRIALIGDASPTSDAGLKLSMDSKNASRVILVKQPRTFKEWKRVVKRINRTADALVMYTYHTLINEAGNSEDPKKVLSWTVDNSDIPTVSLFSFGIDDGALLGYVNSSYETGLKAGQWALGLLEGKSISDYHITSEVKGQTMLNLETARRLNLEVSSEFLKNVDVRIEGASTDG